jgi:hypothetical protein
MATLIKMNNVVEAAPFVITFDDEQLVTTERIARHGLGAAVARAGQS